MKFSIYLNKSVFVMDLDHPEHVQGIIMVFTLHSYILYIPMSLLGDREALVYLC